MGAVAVSRTPRVEAFDDVDPRVAGLVARTIGVDAHNHIDVPLTAAEVPGPDLDLAGELKRSGLSAICATFAVDYQKLGEPGVAYDRMLNAMKSLDAQLTRNHIQRALNLNDLQTGHDRGQPTIVQAVEGGHFLEGKLERVEEAHKRGLRVLGLLHDSDASVPLGDIYTAPAHLGGLTEFGASVIKECNRLGILIDLTHASVTTVAAALKVSTKPVVFSHTGLDTRLGSNPGMGQMMRPRLINKEHAKTIADAGGVIGVWTHLVDSPAEYVQAIRDMVDAAGIDHVCIGTDTKLTPGNRPGGGPGRRPDSRPAGRPASGPGGPPRGPGGGQGRGRMGDRTNQAWADQKVGFYYAVVNELLKQGFADAEIGKLGGGNFCRVFDAATSSHD
jgi:microsomal dipeptidase-like Zn-dependent dipeptidase